MISAKLDISRMTKSLKQSSESDCSYEQAVMASVSVKRDLYCRARGNNRATQTYIFPAYSSTSSQNYCFTRKSFDNKNPETNSKGFPGLSKYTQSNRFYFGQYRLIIANFESTVLLL